MPEYVYDGELVKLTGRKAKRAQPTPQIQRRRQPPSTVGREVILHEIQPMDNVVEWKKWVQLEELFEVIE